MVFFTLSNCNLDPRSQGMRKYLSTSFGPQAFPYLKSDPVATCSLSQVGGLVFLLRFDPLYAPV